MEVAIVFDRKGLVNRAFFCETGSGWPVWNEAVKLAGLLNAHRNDKWQPYVARYFTEQEPPDAE